MEVLEDIQPAETLCVGEGTGVLDKLNWVFTSIQA